MVRLGEPAVGDWRWSVVEQEQEEGEETVRGWRSSARLGLVEEVEQRLPRGLPD